MKKDLPFWKWVYPIALAATVVAASGQGEVAAPAIVNFDKLVHFSVFGLLATLVLRMLGRRSLPVAVVLVSVFGASDELRQSLTPGRTMDLSDWIADTAGAVVAVAAYSVWPWYRRLLETPLFARKRRVEKSPEAVPTGGAS